MQSDKMKNDKHEKVLQLIKNNDTEREFFFSQLEKANDPIEWFDPLKRAGYLNPKRNPKPYKKEDTEGLYTVIYWNVLGFILNVANKNISLCRNDITEELIKFIDSVIDYRDENGERIDNFRTDWAISRLMFLLPASRLKIKYINFLRTAMRSKWNTSLIANVILDNGIPFLLKNKLKKHLLKLITILFEYKKMKKGSYTDEYVSIIDRYWLQRIMDNYRLKIAEFCGIEALDISERLILEITNKDKSQFNLIWIPQIDGNTTKDMFLDRYQVQSYLPETVYFN